jgi:hypothetical protein
MKARYLWAMVLLAGLLCGADSRADTTCGLIPGDRVRSLVNNPWGASYLYAGHTGTVVCCDPDDMILPLLISFDNWYWGNGDGTLSWCETSIQPHELYTLWWVGCSDIEEIPEGTPDLFDGGERERYFTPQTLVSGKANQAFEVGFKVVEGGTASPGDIINVAVYASSDTYISRSDYLLGTTNYFYLGQGGSLNKSLKTIFPTNIPPGFYYIGWIIDPENRINNELNETNNIAHLESYRLLVSAPSGTPSLAISAAPGGQVVVPGEGVFTYAAGQVVPVEALADPDCSFAGWAGTAVDAGKVLNPSAPGTQVTVDVSRTLTALFDGPHLIVDDFESYDDPNNPIQSVWLDGLGWMVGEPQGHRGNETGAIIGIADGPSPMHPVGAENLVMFLDYDNTKSPYYSEISRRWGDLQNWAATGADKLSLWFRGVPGNSAQPMAVIVEDCYGVSAVAPYPNAQGPLKTTWTQWTIPLSQIENAGVMMSRIVKLTICVGERDDIFGAGAGTLYFDDIALMHE